MLQVPAIYKNRGFNRVICPPPPSPSHWNSWPCVKIKLCEAREERKALGWVNSNKLLRNIRPHKQREQKKIIFTCPGWNQRMLLHWLVRWDATKGRRPITNCQESLPIKEAKRNKVITGFIWYAIKLPWARVGSQTCEVTKASRVSP